MLATKIAQYCAEKYGVPLCDRQGALNIVYIEGANMDGTPNNDEPDKWNDVRYLVGMQDGKWEILFSQTATTEPGRYYTVNPMDKRGAARIGFGYHPHAWAEGFHKGKHIALIQKAPVRISRDANRDGKRSKKEPEYASPPVGINHHSTFDGFKSDSIGKHGAGCLVGEKMAPHITFIQMLRLDPRRIYSDKNGKEYLHDCWVIPGDDFGRFEVKPTAGNIEGPKEQLTQSEMLNTTPLFPVKDVKIKKGSQPKGTTHGIPATIGKSEILLTYTVYDVRGTASWFSTEDPVIYLKYTGGPIAGGVVPPFLSITLDMFAAVAAPISKSDIFWE